MVPKGGVEPPTRGFSVLSQGVDLGSYSTFLSLLTQVNNIPEVSLINGHKDVKMRFRYKHLKAEDIISKLWEQ